MGRLGRSLIDATTVLSWTITTAEHQPLQQRDHQTHEQAIGLAQARPFDASLVSRELLTKSKILKSEASAAGENQVE